MISATSTRRVNGLVFTWPLKSTEYGLKKFTNPPIKRRKLKKARKTKEDEKIQFLKKTLACWLDLVDF